MWGFPAKKRREALYKILLIDLEYGEKYEKKEEEKNK